ncbi:hypothetical protein HC248_01795 [Polaromonas vacuolata]|uniref:Uncharacterized protein n=1 Tax=Polaromonas vacuolata TaxID=37448 RepID=A0A6H2H9E1_9BURK|nr:hypothetical protein HC248_01795 [Polaromonas vacuolata]
MALLILVHAISRWCLCVSDRGGQLREEFTHLCPKCKSAFTYEDGKQMVFPECAHEWAQDAAPVADMRVWKDANGNVLQDGDTTSLAKDLKIKASSSVVKVGTKIKKHSPDRRRP